MEEIEDLVPGATAKLLPEVETMKQVNNFVWVIISLFFIYKNSTYESYSLQSWRENVQDECCIVSTYTPLILLILCNCPFFAVHRVRASIIIIWVATNFLTWEPILLFHIMIEKMYFLSILLHERRYIHDLLFLIYKATESYLINLVRHPFLFRFIFKGKKG